MNYQPIPSYLKEYAHALTLIRVEINKKDTKGLTNKEQEQSNQSYWAKWTENITQNT